MSRVVYYAAMSLDGYIAEADDNIDWLTGFEAVPPGDGVTTVSGVHSARSTRSGFRANTAPLMRVTRITYIHPWVVVWSWAGS